MTDIVLFSTTDAANGRPEVLERMIASVARELTGMPDDTRCVLALLLQNCPDEQLHALRATLPPFVAAFAIPGRISLSAARNVLFNCLRHGQIEPDAVVGFPDDDCWYPDGSLAFITRQFKRRPTLDFWFCRYASSPAAPKNECTSRPATVRDVVRNASSNTIFVRGGVLARINRFDETLGVGTPNLGGEDLDFAMRAHGMARLSLFCDQAAVGHRDKLAHLRATYYRGSLMVLARNAFRNIATAREYIRKVVVGLYLVLRREMSLGAYIAANTLALAELRHPNKQHG